MNQKLMERLSGFTLILLGIVMFLFMLVFFADVAFLTVILMILLPILGIISFITGLLMWLDSKEQ